MSRSAKVRLSWGGDERTFKLGVGELDEFDALCDIGPGYALALIESAGVHGNWRAKHIREAIRLGLIGGGIDQHQALRLVKRYVDGRPLGENLATAANILRAAIVGVPDDPVPGLSGEGSNASLSPEGASGSDNSTKPEPPSASAFATSKTVLSGSSATPSKGGDAPTGRRKKASTKASSTASAA
ncbi:MAG: gene transfer agent family protein [Caulobacteraceae bacterium]